MKPSISFIRLALDCTATAIVTGLAVVTILTGIVLLFNGRVAADNLPSGCRPGAIPCYVQNHKDLSRP